jgi:hypothetical protein
MARPEGFEPPTTKFVAWYSIQLSYGREAAQYAATGTGRQHPLTLPALAVKIPRLTRSRVAQPVRASDC